MHPAKQLYRAAALAGIGLTLQFGVLAAQQTTGQEAERDTIRAVAIDTVRIGGRIDNLIGTAAVAAQGRIGAEDLRLRPLSRETEILEAVPGLIVTQHSGEGKANQYFIRGFNLDHGTDFLTRVEGMPVNLPTHGHGQGYTDLNFIIPEFVDLLDYRLGVYHAELGDFSSAGGAEFHLAHRLDRPFVGVNVGEFGLARVVAGGSGSLGGGDLLLGGEAKVYDGPWQLDQNVRKGNGIGRYTLDRGSSRFSLLALAYRNEWNASDQIPLRAVDDGSIDRFGQVDRTNGGEAARYSLSGTWRRLGQTGGQEVQLFGIYSDLDLFSNFTYFLEDPSEGDQFHQKDSRIILGANAKHLQDVIALGAHHALSAGVQGRTDLIGEVGLHRTFRRARLETIRDDEVTQFSGGVYMEAVSLWRPTFRSVLGLRGDLYGFDVRSDHPQNSGSHTEGMVSPKGSLIFTPSSRAEFYLSGGFGFHSNDARGVTINVDPATGEAADPVDPLVRSRGAEIGVRTAPVPGLRSTLTFWALNLDSELLFVGDAGATEPSLTSMRRGITFANFYRPLPQLTLDADISFSRARLDAPAEENRIPGALERVLAGGLAWSPEAGVSGALRLRHFGEYPLIEDNSVRADAATLINAEVGYRFGSRLRLELHALNLLDSEAADIQYFYTSRLPGEPAGGVDDVHFHPAEPRQLRLLLQWDF